MKIDFLNGRVLTFTVEDLNEMKKQTTAYLAAKDQYKLQMERTVKEMDK